MRREIVVLAAVLIAMPSVAFATGLDLSFNDQAVQAVVSQYIHVDYNGLAEANLRALYSKPDDTFIGSVGGNVLGTSLFPGLDLGAGIKGYFGNADAGDVLAAGLGVMASYSPEVLPKVAFTMGFFYCPGVLSGEDTNRLYEFETKAKYKIIPRAAAFISYSEIRADFDDGYHTLDDGFRIGMEFEF